MPFGLTVAADAPQHKLDTIYHNLDFCTGITGDMTIWGKQADGSNHDNLDKLNSRPCKPVSLVQFVTLDAHNNLKMTRFKTS